MKLSSKRHYVMDSCCNVASALELSVTIFLHAIVVGKHKLEIKKLVSKLIYSD